MISEEYFKIPYLENGRGWDGADCYGFVRLVIEQETGFIMPILDGKTMPDDDDFLLYEKQESPEELSLVFLSGGPFKEAHVGIFTHGTLLNMTCYGPVCMPWRKVKRFVKGIYKPKRS